MLNCYFNIKQSDESTKRCVVSIIFFKNIFFPLCLLYTIYIYIYIYKYIYIYIFWIPYIKCDKTEWKSTLWLPQVY